MEKGKDIKPDETPLSAKQVGNCIQSIVISIPLSNWKNVMCSIPQLSVLLPGLFSVLINDLHSAGESMLIKFADNMKL